MVKKFLASAVAAMIIIITPPPVSAEQAAAEQFWQMFRSGNFCVEFRITNEPAGSIKPFNVLAEQNGERVYRESLRAKNPITLYRDGKYYNFYKEYIDVSIDKFNRRTFILPKDEIDSSTLDPDEGWQFVRQNLSLPDELAIFYWDDPYRNNNSDWTTSVYDSSFAFEFDYRLYDCDQYTSDIKSLAGTVIAQEIYRALYKDEKLVMVAKYFRRNGKETFVRVVQVKNITSQVPDNAFAINKKTKTYLPHNGDMNDLTNTYQKTGEIGGKSK